jgi:hypothetical protein
VDAPACVDTDGVRREVELTTVRDATLCSLHGPRPLTEEDHAPADLWSYEPGAVVTWECPHVGGSSLLLRRVDGEWRVLTSLSDWYF